MFAWPPICALNPGASERFLVQSWRTPTSHTSERPHLSIDRKRTETLHALICELTEAGRAEFRPGDLCTLLRERNQPLGAWLVRREFSTLEAQGLIAIDPASGLWRRTGKQPQAAAERPLDAA